MAILRSILVNASLIVSAVSAQAIESQIPEVASVVASVTNKFGKYIQYAGPTGTATKHVNAVATSAATSSACSYWLEDIAHQGVAAFNSDSSYQVFRNVKDFGAVGDGVTDDTAAINAAISSSNRCAPGSCSSSTTTPAVVYFPAGTYAISSSIIDYYFTQIIGNPNCRPTIRALPNFSGLGLFNGDPYTNTGNLAYGSTNVFWRQIRNFNIDMTFVPANSNVAGVHWPTAQATSLQNIFFNMSTASGTQHTGLFIENGSGGFMADLTFNGGLYGLNIGNQQFTMRNLTISNCGTAINQLWDWGWTYSGITINNCSIGLDISAGGSTAQGVASAVLFDSTIKNTPTGIKTAHNGSSAPATAGSLIVNNVALQNVPIAIAGPSGTSLTGSKGSLTISGWGEGHAYSPSGPTNFQGAFNPMNRPAGLLTGNNFYARSKPQYANLPTGSFLSARSAGAKGDGVTDDTKALQSAITQAASAGQVMYFDAGTYKVTATLNMPPGSKWVGESYSVIMASGSFFSSMANPKPVVKVGTAGQQGTVEWSDMIVSTQGATAGAVLIAWNLNSPSTSPSGMWDVHTRIGGFTGSQLQAADCPTTPNTSTINKACIAAYMAMHINKAAAGIYLENNWFWLADHDADDANLTQITVYSGRGLLIESTAGNIWLVGTAAEHHTLYQYQISGSQNIFGGQMQTETPYYQPNPDATKPFPPVASIHDPNFAKSCAGKSSNCARAWGLRVLGSKNIFAYGAGFYSFFDNYSTTCSGTTLENCQSSIVSIDSASSRVALYNLNTIGATCQVQANDNGTCYASESSNPSGFAETVAIFQV